MATGDIKLVYPSQDAVTITLASLNYDNSKLQGQESTAIDNTSNLYLDYLVSGKVTTGTNPTASKSIEVWAVGYDGAAWPDVFDGTDSAETITSAEIKASVCKLVASIATTNTSNRTYPFGPVSLSAVFGGAIPPKFVFFVTHDTGQTLNATAGNHAIVVQPVYWNVAA